MICLNQYREPIDLEDSPFRMPTTVILEPHDKEDVVYDKLSARYAKLIEQWQEEERDRFYKRETRYENDHEEPAFPILICRWEQSKRVKPEVVLLDGRRAVLLDSNRIQTQCGIQVIMSLELAQGLRRQPGHTRFCPSCKGKHLPPLSATSLKLTPVSSTIPCTKCQADLRSASYWDDSDTLVCRHCAQRYARPLHGLTSTETSANESAISDWVLSSQPTADLPVDSSDSESRAGSQDPDDHEDLEIEQDPGQDPEDLGLTTEEPRDPSMYDDPVTMSEVPETTPLNLDELHQVLQLVQHPEARHASTNHPIIVQQLIALAEHRMTDEASDQEFQETFRAVVSEEISHLSDLLHEPAYQLFQMSRSPMRQTLLDRALQAKDNPTTRMAVWAAAGRLLKECNLPWLNHFSLSPQDLPKSKDERIHHFLTLHAEDKARVQPIVDWLLSLGPEDLSILAGDPESTHPFLHHPDPSVFETTDSLMTGLIAYLANDLQRFREKKAGCRLKASDHGLAVESLHAIAIQRGLMPAPPATTVSPAA